MKKKGQLTIFIILGIIIVVLGILIFLFFPKIQLGLGFSTSDPNIFIQNCMEDETKELVEKLSLQGGSFNPENYILYQDEKIEYLCYSNEDYIPCVMQKPLLKSSFENEIKSNLIAQKNSCLESLKESFESQGFDVQITPGDFEVKILPERVEANLGESLTLSKDSAERYSNLKTIVNSNLYTFLGIASSILNMEANYGDSETTIYMNYYHDLKLEKLKQGDGSTIYIITNREEGDKFQFASRSVVFPAGI